MTDFKAKMLQIPFQLGFAPDPVVRAYSAPLDSLAGFGGRFAAGGGAGLGKRRGRRGRGGKGRAHKLLLNQGPSEPCYATAAQHHNLLRVWHVVCSTYASEKMH